MMYRKRKAVCVHPAELPISAGMASCQKVALVANEVSKESDDLVCNTSDDDFQDAPRKKVKTKNPNDSQEKAGPRKTVKKSPLKPCVHRAELPSSAGLVTNVVSKESDDLFCNASDDDFQDPPRKKVKTKNPNDSHEKAGPTIGKKSPMKPSVHRAELPISAGLVANVVSKESVDLFCNASDDDFQDPPRKKVKTKNPYDSHEKAGPTIGKKSPKKPCVHRAELPISAGLVANEVSKESDDLVKKVKTKRDSKANPNDFQEKAVPRKKGKKSPVKPNRDKAIRDVNDVSTVLGDTSDDDFEPKRTPTKSKPQSRLEK
ncbi:nucleolar protein dao-5-like isoform X2 [Thrips palmi]|uniref:Nucleolar protein dao-5-like isoform X2 n=1 Tax=Thrips palmi TaxID=161013 RepID=A0A6P8Z3D3_THRPL|nr:nucleolar protein dao-5-like isoform X2 [Thrips palmi]